MKQRNSIQYNKFVSIDQKVTRFPDGCVTAAMRLVGSIVTLKASPYILVVIDSGYVIVISLWFFFLILTAPMFISLKPSRGAETTTISPYDAWICPEINING